MFKKLLSPLTFSLLLLTTSVTPNGIINKDHQFIIESLLDAVQDSLDGAPESIKKDIRNAYADKLYKAPKEQIIKLNCYNNPIINPIIENYAKFFAKKEMQTYTTNHILIDNFGNDWASSVQEKFNNKEVIGSSFSYMLKNTVEDMFKKPTPQPTYIPVHPTPSAPLADKFHYVSNLDYYYDMPLSYDQQKRKQDAEKYEANILLPEDMNKEIFLNYFYKSILHDHQFTPLYNPPTFHLENAAKNLYSHMVRNVKSCLEPHINNKQLLEEACKKVETNGHKFITDKLFKSATLQDVFSKDVLNKIQNNIEREMSDIRCCICFKLFVEDSNLGSVNKIVTQHTGTRTSCKATACKQCLSKPECKKYQCQNCTTPINKADLDVKLKQPVVEQTYRRPV